MRVADQPGPALRAAWAGDGQLPGWAYCDEAHLRLEEERVFRGSWVLAGAAGELPAVGDAKPLEIAGRALILLRDETGIRALSNVCPHRGARVLGTARRGLRRLTCPYHHWSFDLAGRVRLRPHFHGRGQHDTEGGREGGDACLETVRTALWQDLIFLDFTGAAPPLDDHLRAFLDHFAGFDFQAMAFGGGFAIEAPGNWKLVAENYLDNYHIFALHPTIDAAFDQARRRPARLVAPPLILGGYDMEDLDRVYLPGLAPNPRIAPALRRRNSFFCLFPNVLMHVWPYAVMVMQLLPLSPARTLERYFFYFHDQEGDPGEAAQEARRKAMAEYRRINEKEDFPIIAAMQESRASGAFDQGRLSPFWDGMIRDYAALYLEALERA